MWEHERDPGAVLEALRLVDLPEWLCSALVVLVTDGEVFGMKPLRKRMFLDRAKRLTERERAFQIAVARAVAGETLDQAIVTAKDLNKLNFPRDGFDGLTNAGMRRAYERVAQRLQAHPFSYYVHLPGLQTFIADAWTATVDRWGTALKSQNDDRPK